MLVLSGGLICGKQAVAGGTEFWEFKIGWRSVSEKYAYCFGQKEAVYMGKKTAHISDEFQSYLFRGFWVRRLGEGRITEGHLLHVACCSLKLDLSWRGFEQ